MTTKRLLGACVASMFSLLAAAAVGNPPALEAGQQNLEGGQALLAIETHRTAIVNRLLVDYAPEMTQRKLDAEVLRTLLNALRADQLLAASLVSTLDELLRAVQQPMQMMGEHYVAITPTDALELRELPEARAYLVRDGDALNVVKPGELQLNGRNRVVGYFTAETVTNVTTVIQEKPFVKDDPGTGTNSWIGYSGGNNQASGTGSAVAAGTNNVASGLNSFVGAGTFNAANGQGSFVGGGTSKVANATSALVMGGFDNQATVIDSAVVAGAGNRATGARSVVVGGGYNLAGGQWSFVGGGGRQSGSGAAGTYVDDNVAAGDWSTIAGGRGNRASGFHSIVAGGQGNTAEYFASVGGGQNNIASGDFSTISGGIGNTASGAASTVAGGAGNLAGAAYSFAAGNRAKVIAPGSFVFSDSTDADFYSGVANEFLVGATGGIGMYTAKNYSTGCHINPGGASWLCSSSRDVKRDFEVVDVEQVLRRVSQLPMLKWRFMNEDAKIRHLGPMAQDFRAAFGLGTDDRTIATVDENGVALAAIQGLNRKLNEKDAKIDALIEELRAQRIEIAELQSTRADVVAMKSVLGELLRERRNVGKEGRNVSARSH
jgi:hypothetical protein